MHATENQIVSVTAVPGVSHTEGLCGEVLNDVGALNNEILRSLGEGSFPQKRVPVGLEVRWRGANVIQHLETIVDVAFRPLNTGGYYWVLIVRVASDHEVNLEKGVGQSRRCKLGGRHLMVTRSAGKWYAWLLPDQFALHSPLVRDMIFSGDSDEQHRLIFAQLHTLTSVFWGI